MYDRDASGTCNPLRFLINPAVVLRALEILFSIIVFGALADKGTLYGMSVYNGDKAPLDFAIGIGVFSFVVALLLFGVMIYNQMTTSLMHLRKKLLIVDIGLSALITFFWFIAFCWTANAWRLTPDHSDIPAGNRNAAQTGIAFAFFSILVWAGSAALNFIAFRRPADAGSEYAGAADPSTPYAAFTETP